MEEEKGQTRSWLIKAPLPAGGNKANKCQNLSVESLPFKWLKYIHYHFHLQWSRALINIAHNIS
jgi:hypothetical protein